MRKMDWQASFWAAVEAERAGAFVWGQRDCVFTATRVCDSIVEEPRLEAAARSFGTWTTALEAAAVLKRIDDLRVPISYILGSPISGSWLQQGDLVLCSYNDPNGIFQHTLAFHDGHTPMTAGDRKLVPVESSRVICGWRIE